MFCLQTAIQTFVERTAVVFFGRMVWRQIERLHVTIRTHCWTLKSILVSMFENYTSFYEYKFSDFHSYSNVSLKLNTVTRFLRVCSFLTL